MVFVLEFFLNNKDIEIARENGPWNKQKGSPPPTRIISRH